MSIRFIRSIHYKRIPNYRGYWDRILEQPNSNRSRTPIPIPIEIIEEPHVPSRPKQFVYLKGVPLEVPEKPEQPTNCCMSGCAHCVWDIYQEDIDDYRHRKESLIQRFKDAGEQVPKELEAEQDDMETMDPSMKAFLEMEKKLK